MKRLINPLDPIIVSERDSATLVVDREVRRFIRVPGRFGLSLGQLREEQESEHPQSVAAGSPKTRGAARIWRR